MKRISNCRMINKLLGKNPARVLYQISITIMLNIFRLATTVISVEFDV